MSEISMIERDIIRIENDIKSFVRVGIRDHRVDALQAEYQRQMKRIEDLKAEEQPWVCNASGVEFIPFSEPDPIFKAEKVDTVTEEVVEKNNIKRTNNKCSSCDAPITFNKFMDEDTVKCPYCDTVNFV